jgi:hypothetical protein
MTTFDETLAALLAEEPIAGLLKDGLLILRDGKLLVPGNLTPAQEDELSARIQDPRKLN